MDVTIMSKHGKTSKTHPTEQRIRTAAVVGAGVAGCEAAIALAESGFQVTLYDQNKDILRGSSNATPACLNSGLHYPDMLTVKKLMADVESFLTHYPPPIICVKNDDKTIRTRYYAVPKKAAAQSARGQSVESHFSAINQYWKSQNQYFPTLATIGAIKSPDKFVEKLTEEELQELKTRDIVSAGIAAVYRTREPFLNLEEYRGQLRESLTDCKVVLKLEQAVKKIGDRGVIELSKCEQGDYKEYDAVVNASWAHADSIGNEVSGITNRIKVMAELSNKAMASAAVGTVQTTPSPYSIVAVYGEFASMTHRNGSLFLTYEPETNIGRYESTKDSMDACWKNVVAIEGYGEAERNQVIARIVAGAKQFYPGISDEKRFFRALRVGVVRNRGRLTEGKDSSHHSRTETGLFITDDKVIRAEAIKLPNGFVNAQRIKNAAMAASNAAQTEKKAQVQFEKVAKVCSLCLFSFFRNTRDTQRRLREKQDRAYWGAFKKIIEFPNKAEKEPIGLIGVI